MKRNLLFKVMFAAMLFLSVQFVNAQKSQCTDADQGAGTKCATTKVCEAKFATMTIDGDTDDWDGLTEYKVVNVSAGPDLISGATDLSGVMKVAYDKTNLYVLVLISDSELQPITNCEACTDRWMWDNLEIFTNGFFENDVPETGAYTKEDDNQIRINLGREVGIDESNTIKVDHVVFVQQETGDGWMAEVSIQWAAILNKEVDIPEFIGFEISVGDADTDGAAAGAGTRESILTWANDTGADQSWLDTRCFGYLKTLPFVDPGTAVKAVETSSMSIAENPVKNELIVRNAGKGALKVSDMTGKVVMEIENNAEILNLNVAKLSKGVYFLTGKNSTVKFVKQ